MFERYTEQARRALFFARYAASELHRMSIETEHLLLALLRENKGVTSRLFADAHVTYDAVRERIHVNEGQPIPTSVEIPFTEETKRVLRYAFEESERLQHSYIGTEHLLLGLLREERSVAGSILIGYGMRIESARAEIVHLLTQTPELSEARTDARESHIEQISQAVAQLPFAPAGSREMRELIERIRQSLDELMREDS